MIAARRRVALAGATSIALTALALEAASGATKGVDKAILAWFAGLRHPAADAFFQAATWLGSFWLLGPGVAVVLWRLARVGRGSEALRLGAAFYGAVLTTWLLKPLIGRERPALFDSILPALPADAAFPSGHATQAVALALCLAWLVRRESPYRAAARLLLLTYVGVIAVSRLYLQAHWPSDVLAGILVALVWATVTLYASGATGQEKGPA